MTFRKPWMLVALTAFAFWLSPVDPSPRASAAEVDAPNLTFEENPTTTKLLLRDDVTIPDFVVDSGSVTNARMDSMVAFVDGFQRNSFALCQQEPQARTILSQVVLAEVFVPPLPTEYQLRITSSYRDVVSAHPASVWTFSSHNFVSEGGGGYVLAETPDVSIPLNAGGLNGVLRVAFEKRLSLTGSWSQVGWFEVGVTHVDCSGILALLPCAKAMNQDVELTTVELNVEEGPASPNTEVYGTSQWLFKPDAVPVTGGFCTSLYGGPVGASVPYGPDAGKLETIRAFEMSDTKCYFDDAPAGGKDGWRHDGGWVRLKLDRGAWGGKWGVAFYSGQITLGRSSMGLTFPGNILGEASYPGRDFDDSGDENIDRAQCEQDIQTQGKKIREEMATEYLDDALKEPLTIPGTATVCIIAICASNVAGEVVYELQAGGDYHFSFAAPDKMFGEGESYGYKHAVAAGGQYVES